MKIKSVERANLDQSEPIGRYFGGLFKPGAVRNFLRSGYHQFLMAKTGWRGLPYVMPDGECLRILPGYRFACIMETEYQAFKKAVKPGSVVLDIGANVGAYSILFGMWAGNNGKVYAFEPSPETFSGLQGHVKLNHLDKTVFPQQVAISDQKGTMMFLADRFHGTNRLAAQGEKTPDGLVQVVQTLTIDDFCEMNRIVPDVIKVDIEGFELNALKGARRTIKERGAALSLFVEMHPTTWRKIGLTLADIQNEIAAQGWMALPIGDEVPWEAEGLSMRLIPKG